MKIRTFFYTLKQGFVNIARNRWFSLASVATIAACLFLFGVFYSIIANFEHIVKTAEEGVSVTVFFEEGTPDERIEKIGQDIAKRAEVKEVIYHSEDEVWETFGKEYFGENYMDGFPENPLAGENNYEVFLSDVSLQSALVTWLDSLPEVRKINYSEVTASTLSGANLLIAYVSLGIIIILIAVSVFLISNTVRMGIELRNDEIRIMKYIGATDFFARAPYVFEGMIIGLVGAIVPLLIINGIYNYALNYVTGRFEILSGFLNFLSVGEVFGVLIPVSLIMGVGIGFFGSLSSARKYLHV